MDLRAQLHEVAPVRGRQFAIFRIAFGAYLALYFARLIPWGDELFSRDGVVARVKFSATSRLFPDVLARLDSPRLITVFLALLVVGSVLFALGVYRRPIAVVLWYGWACLFNRNVLIENPATPYIGLLLVLTATIPATEPWRFKQKDYFNDEFFVPRLTWVTAWLLLAVGYTLSGLAKIHSPSWVDGSALLHLMNTPVARPGMLRDLVLSLPPAAVAGLTWSAVALEILFLPLIVWRMTRPFAWGAMIALQIGMMLVMRSTDLAVAMLLVHLFTYDPRWYKRKAVVNAPLANRWTPVQIG